MGCGWTQKRTRLTVHLLKINKNYTTTPHPPRRGQSRSAKIATSPRAWRERCLSRRPTDHSDVRDATSRVRVRGQRVRCCAAVAVVAHHVGQKCVFQIVCCSWVTLQRRPAVQAPLAVHVQCDPSKVHANGDALGGVEAVQGRAGDVDILRGEKKIGRPARVSPRRSSRRVASEASAPTMCYQTRAHVPLPAAKAQPRDPTHYPHTLARR